MNETIDCNESATELGSNRDLGGPDSGVENLQSDPNREQTRSCGDVILSKNSPTQDGEPVDMTSPILVTSPVTSYGTTYISNK